MRSEDGARSEVAMRPRLLLAVAAALCVVGWMVLDLRNARSHEALVRLAEAIVVGSEVGVVHRKCGEFEGQSITCEFGQGAVLARGSPHFLIPSRSWILIIEHAEGRVTAVVFRSDDSEVLPPRGSPADRGVAQLGP